MSPEEPVFRQVASGGHASLRVVERSKHPDTGRLRRDIVVDDIRALSDFYRLTSARGNWRVAVIDSADDMNANAANALLKVLEEPPERSILILVSHAPGRLLPTIRSRCRSVHMTSLAPGTIVEALRHFGCEVADADFEPLLDLADGSLGMAVRILRNGGIELHRQIQELVARPHEPSGNDVIAFAERMARNGQDESYEMFVHMFERHLSRVTFDRARSGAGELDRWLEVWEKVGALFARGNAVALDRKHVILNAFLHLSEAAGTRAAR